MGVIKQYDIATTGPNAALLKKVTRVDRREAPGVLFLGGPAHPSAAPHTPRRPPHQVPPRASALRTPYGRTPRR